MALHAAVPLSHDSPHPDVHSVVWGIHRFPGWLFLELICAAMSLTLSICYTSSGTNLSNLSSHCVVPPKFRVIHACVSACSERPHILLHYSDGARFLMSPHIKLVCIGPFSTSRSSFNARLYVTTSHPALWAPPQLTKVISQSHVNTHMHYFHPLSCSFFFCKSVPGWLDMRI